MRSSPRICDGCVRRNEWYFPVSIEYDEPEVADEEYSIQVHDFEEL
ncbi:MAG: hypothetical protein GY926_13790 [bacterium]|nr:hypothetical protein [bacterium]